MSHVPHSYRAALADAIEKQVEEAAQMGEPPSFALRRDQADALVRILRRYSLVRELEKDIESHRYGKPLAAALQCALELEREIARWENDYAGWCVAMMDQGVKAFGTLDQAFKKLTELRQLPPAGPSGGITVPREPTMEMWIAGNTKLPATPIEDSTDYTRAIWTAMLEASPPATDGGNK